MLLLFNSRFILLFVFSTGTMKNMGGVNRITVREAYKLIRAITLSLAIKLKCTLKGTKPKCILNKVVCIEKQHCDHMPHY